MMETAIRSTGQSNQAEEWALVLASAGIRHRLESFGDGWTLIVPDEEAAQARDALDVFDAEEAQSSARVRTATPADRPVPWLSGITTGLFLLAAFAIAGQPGAGSRCFERGAAVAASMRVEPWRAVTALTLHLDAAHVAGNAVATAVLLPAIGQRLGIGVGLWLMLMAGAVGNLLAARAQLPEHAAVGASTATFAAIGILGALRLFPGSTESRTRWKPWMIPAACLVLLTMLGTGRGADVLAHVMGVVTGAAVGLGAATVRQPFGPTVQWTLGLLTIGVLVACWLRALS
jgi:rhomboid protease GluP